MTTEELTEFVKLAGGPATVIGLGWWLRGKFSDISNSAKEILASHERQDERRHRQNLVRFAKINMRLGIVDPTALHDDPLDDDPV